MQSKYHYSLFLLLLKLEDEENAHNVDVSSGKIIGVKKDGPGPCTQ